MVWHVSPAIWEIIVNGAILLPGENSKGRGINNTVQTTITMEKTVYSHEYGQGEKLYNVRIQ